MPGSDLSSQSADTVQYDLVIEPEYFLPIDESPGQKLNIFKNSLIAIKGSKIAKVIKDKDQDSAQTHAILKASDKILKLKDQILMPALINGHTHLPMTLLKGLADDLPFEDWLHKAIFPVESKLVESQFVKEGTELAALELIASGCTTAVDMYYFEDSVCQAMSQAGLRLVAGQAFTDFAQPDNKALNNGHFKQFDKMIKDYKGNPLVIPALAPHAIYTCSKTLLTQIFEYALANHLPVLMHISETQSEVANCQKLHGCSPVEYLDKIGFFELSKKQIPVILAHGVHLSDQDILMIAQSGASVIYNPESNMKLGSGVAPIPKLLKSGAKVGLGTDGSASNNNLNLFLEMDSGAKLQKLHCHDNTAMTAEQALRMATIDGAKAIGLDPLIGSIQVGKEADFITLDLDCPSFYPRHDLCSQLVYSANGSEVKNVFCRGKALYLEGQYKTLDPNKVYQNTLQWTQKIEGVLKESLN